MGIFKEDLANFPQGSWKLVSVMRGAPKLDLGPVKIFAQCSSFQANVESAKTLTRLNCLGINKRKLAKYSSSKQNDPYLIFLMVMLFSNETPFVCVVKYVIFIYIYIQLIFISKIII